jgi:hypothetical protein
MRTSLKFLSSSGMQAVISLALTSFHPIPVNLTGFQHPLRRDATHTLQLYSPYSSGSTSHSTLGYEGCEGFEQVKVFDLTDVQFNLPPNALLYERASLSEQGQLNLVSIRRLAIEILSEMSNYRVYREAVGSEPHALNRILALLKCYIMEVVVLCNAHSTHNRQQHQRGQGRGEGGVGNVRNNLNLFIIERLVNFLANIAMDRYSISTSVYLLSSRNL